MKYFETNELTNEIDFYLSRISFYRNTLARFEKDDQCPKRLGGYSGTELNGHDEPHYHMNRTGHQRMHNFWKNAMIWYIEWWTKRNKTNKVKKA